MSEPTGRRCSTCAFTFPLNYEVCAICGGILWRTYSAGPDEDWQEQLTWRLRAVGGVPMFKAEEGLDIEFTPDLSPSWADLVPHKDDNTADLFSRDSLLWVEHEELLECGYLNLTEDYIVFLNGEFYELQGYHRPSKSWWIEPVAIDASELTPEQIIGYGEASEA